MIYHCCDALRRNAVARHPILNGIDYLEIVDKAAPKAALRQRTLLLYLLKPVPATLTWDQVRIDGGERVRNINIAWITPATAASAFVTPEELPFFEDLPSQDQVLLIRTDSYGDYSTYTLRLVQSASNDSPPGGFDPLLSEIDFSFKVECANDFDCQSSRVCPEEVPAGPDINYLAKDYGSFRRLILDRLTQLVPGWRERSAADLGIVLAELLAYVGDNLSYHQDAVATEAYLHTARRRTSLRRHGLLVDYHLHNGCNARVWLHLQVSSDLSMDKSGGRFYTRLANLAERLEPGSAADLEALRAESVIFEPMHAALLYAANNELYFYTWGETRCCLAKGSTKATLEGHWRHLQVGDVLLFEEIVGPKTGEKGDADPTHRQVVRLTSVRALMPLDGVEKELVPLTDPLTGDQITEIAWGDEDRLAFPLCMSSLTDQEHGEQYLNRVSVARGNMVLADHGLTLPEAETLPTVPAARLAYPPERDVHRCQRQTATPIPARFAPELADGPLTFGGTEHAPAIEQEGGKGKRISFNPQGSAASALVWKMADCLPQITLVDTLAPEAEPWMPIGNLLNSGAGAKEFVVEVEHDGRAILRFGDDVYGRRPEPGMTFAAKYRKGNGRIGNVGAETIAHLVHLDARLLSVRNPMAAQGGVDMEDAATLRRHAPQAFRRQERAVSPEDYAEVSERYSGVQRAAATLRWTGSWHTMFITVDRQGGLPVEGDFQKNIAAHIDRYRMAGHDIQLNDPVYVSLELELLVCVKAEYYRADVKRELLQILGSGLLPDGRLALFHPDNLSFGQTIYLSRIYAAARQVSGLASVNATCFKRQGSDDMHGLDEGFLALGRLEVPRLENDANYPEHGVIRINLFGGK